MCLLRGTGPMPRLFPVGAIRLKDLITRTAYAAETQWGSRQMRRVFVCAKGARKTGFRRPSSWWPQDTEKTNRGKSLVKRLSWSAQLGRQPGVWHIRLLFGGNEIWISSAFSLFHYERGSSTKCSRESRKGGGWRTSASLKVKVTLHSPIKQWKNEKNDFKMHRKL